MSKSVTPSTYFPDLPMQLITILDIFYCFDLHFKQFMKNIPQYKKDDIDVKVPFLCSDFCIHSTAFNDLDNI